MPVDIAIVSLWRAVVCVSSMSVVVGREETKDPVTQKKEKQRSGEWISPTDRPQIHFSPGQGTLLQVAQRTTSHNHKLHSMDQGHYNCRDYYQTPHWAPASITNDRLPPPLERHESFTELEQRSRSPASQKPKFPLFKLPLELRQEILSYLLPRTQKFKDSGGLAQHVRDFSAVKKRQARGMPVAATPTLMAVGQNNVVWQRGNVDLLRVNRQLHDECAHLIYGTNTFLLFVSYNGISFRFRWLLPSGLAPSRNYPFLELLSEKYIRLVRKISVSVDLVDSYTGMIKYNVSGAGLTRGLQNQVQRLVNALRSSGAAEGEEESHRQLSRVSIRVQNGDNFLEARKSDLVRQRDGSLKSDDDVAELLEPFSDLYGVGSVSVVGAVSKAYAQSLTRLMTDKYRGDSVKPIEPVEADPHATGVGPAGVLLCAYGNDIK